MRKNEENEKNCEREETEKKNLGKNEEKLREKNKKKKN
jgi:hypothetical protein